ncbi:glycosyltransferase involved in cell wall biosynthesis [Flavobacterium nitrogenifigens]|uniref:Glycosyltransferase involved in cell wall biosynthesis n=2 Tax=Flavobacterium TaxID=237 RepID=A0A7W7J007_9FLAO|nr:MULTISPECIES: glycosyltransferase family 1 protein [Flavobacterium]MBB4803662.1 glycosyltransferase involved in cell wall biosynthesis [Flavobacterium nitrogenifigens]MBB6388533.1 glycosyltransferase involved in cell wall biosynthesis [Flavobacterium notoginsengisoli]
MKIVLDPQIYNMQRYGGISRYYTEVFEIILRERKHKIITPLNNSINVYFENSELNSFQQKLFKFLIKLLKKAKLDKRLKVYNIGKSRLKKILAQQDYNLFVPTYYDTNFLNYIENKPFVLTVYDMIHELFPQYFSDSESLTKNKRLLIEKANRIIAVSENTKKDILKLYPHINEAKIDVIYHGTSIKIKEDTRIDLPEKYILFVGTRQIYKNFVFFIQSISKLLIEEEDLYLVCAGGGSFNRLENELISELGLTDKVVFKAFEDNELGFFYKNAKCFVFPSIYEGFGIPVLESMACGCPVILANHSSFPEVAGEAGIYFELNNPTDLESKIANIINDETLRNDFSQKGIEQAKKFTWENAALKCIKVYEKACNSY